jgi:hypothetical protein
MRVEVSLCAILLSIVCNVPVLAKPEALEVKMQLAVVKNGAGGSIVKGKTNLPDGTPILATVQGKSNNFSGQDKAVVQYGQFEAGPFGSQTGLPYGQYSVEVGTPYTRFWPVSSQLLVGKKGEYLRGSLIKQGSLGAVVAKEQFFQLTAKSVTSRIDLVAVRRAQTALTKKKFQYVAELRTLLSTGRSMEVLRHSDDWRQCGKMMRQLQPKADLIESQVKQLNRPDAFYLGVAANVMDRCVSCSDDALQSCDQAEQAIAGKL